jgi:DNA primase
MDFLALYQAGFKYAVATLGTALTQEHVRALTRFAEEIIISYDGDKAGEDASLRGIDLFVHTGCQVRVLVLPKGFDPDEYILQKGIASFQNLIDQAPYFLDYKLDKLCEQFDPTTPYGQRDIARGMMQLLGKMEDEVLQSAWIKKCAHKLKINEDLLRRQIEGGVKTEPFRETRRTETPAREPDRLSIENELFRYLFEMPELAKEACALLSPEDFKDPILKQNFATICGLYSEGNWNGVHSLLAGIEDSNQVSFLSALSARPIETK